jgi:hypothetical protein
LLYCLALLFSLVNTNSKNDRSPKTIM